jgi:hypothetical protein
MDQFASPFPVSEGVVDVRRAAQRDVALFAALTSAWPMEQAPFFNELLDAIDEAPRRSAHARP